MQASCLVLAAGRGPARNRGPRCTTGADLALPLLYVSKTLFHPVLGCVMVSLATMTTRCSGQKCWNTYFCWQVTNVTCLTINPALPLAVAVAIWMFLSFLTSKTIVFTEGSSSNIPLSLRIKEYCAQGQKSGRTLIDSEARCNVNSVYGSQKLHIGIIYWKKYILFQISFSALAGSFFAVAAVFYIVGHLTASLSSSH